MWFIIFLFCSIFLVSVVIAVDRKFPDSIVEKLLIKRKELLANKLRSATGRVQASKLPMSQHENSKIVQTKLVDSQKTTTNSQSKNSKRFPDKGYKPYTSLSRKKVNFKNLVHSRSHAQPIVKLQVKWSLPIIQVTPKSTSKTFKDSIPILTCWKISSKKITKNWTRSTKN